MLLLAALNPLKNVTEAWSPSKMTKLPQFVLVFNREYFCSYNIIIHYDKTLWFCVQNSPKPEV